MILVLGVVEEQEIDDKTNDGGEIFQGSQSLGRDLNGGSGQLLVVNHLIDQVRYVVEQVSHFGLLGLTIHTDHQLLSSSFTNEMANGPYREINSLQVTVIADFDSAGVIPYELECLPLVLSKVRFL